MIGQGKQKKQNVTLGHLGVEPKNRGKTTKMDGL